MEKFTFFTLFFILEAWIHFNFKTKMYATMINLRRKTYKSSVLCRQRAPSSDRFENLPELKQNTKPTPPELCWRYRRGLVASIVCVTYTGRQCVHCAGWHPECVYYPKLRSSSPAALESESVGVCYSAQLISQHVCTAAQPPASSFSTVLL